MRISSRWFPPLVVVLAAWGTLSAAAGPSVVITEWAVPTPNSMPHDPAVAPDGALWYTGQLSNTLGRLDPATGAIKEFPLRTRDSGPHGLSDDAAGLGGWIGWKTQIEIIRNRQRCAGEGDEPQGKETPAGPHQRRQIEYKDHQGQAAPADRHEHEGGIHVVSRSRSALHRMNYTR